MKSAKTILNECFLGVIDFNEEAAIDAMQKYAEEYHKSEVKKLNKPAVIKLVCPNCKDEDIEESKNNYWFCNECGWTWRPGL